MFFTVLERSITLAQHHTGTLFRAGWAYILLLVALNFAIGAALMPETGFKTVSYMTEPVEAADEGALRALAALANLLVGFSIAIAYVRRILIGANDFPIVVSGRTIKVVYYMFVLGLIGHLSLIPLIILSVILAGLTAGAGMLLLFAAPFIALMVVQRVLGGSSGRSGRRSADLARELAGNLGPWMGDGGFRLRDDFVGWTSDRLLVCGSLRRRGVGPRRSGLATDPLGGVSHGQHADPRLDFRQPARNVLRHDPRTLRRSARADRGCL